MQKALLCFLFVVLAFAVKCQSNTRQIDSLIALSEQYYGANDKLNYGRLYRIKDRGASGHPFFESQEYQTSTLFIKGNNFDSIPARLDLENRLLMVQLVQSGRIREVIISAEALDSFSLLNHFFIRGNLVNADLPFYYEKIHLGQLNLVRGFEKEFVSIYSKTNPRGKYSSLQKKLILVSAGEIFNVNSKRKFIKALPDSELLVKQWLKENKLKFKKLSSEQLQELIKKCEADA
jgi:hypothetical protein